MTESGDSGDGFPTNQVLIVDGRCSGLEIPVIPLSGYVGFAVIGFSLVVE
jgi:hypothetical protein